MIVFVVDYFELHTISCEILKCFQGFPRMWLEEVVGDFLYFFKIKKHLLSQLITNDYERINKLMSHSQLNTTNPAASRLDALFRATELRLKCNA